MSDFVRKHRLLHFVALVLEPLQATERSPWYAKWIPAAGALSAAVGTWVLGVWAGYSTAWRVVIVLGIAVLLVGWAGYRLLGRFDAYEERKPLEIEEVDEDQAFRRLVVRNPNAFPIFDAYVRVVRYRILDGDHSQVVPPNGYRFSWCTYGRSNSDVLSTIGRESSDVVDVAFLTTGQQFHHAYSGDNRTVTANFPLKRGLYEMDVEIGAQRTDIRPRHETLRIAYDGELGLELSVV
jgi:hypothetical protein